MSDQDPPPANEPRFEPRSESYQRDPYPVYARLRNEAPAHWTTAGDLVLSRHADVTEVLRDPRTFSSSPMVGTSEGGVLRAPQGDQSPVDQAVLVQDPPLHTRQRAILARGFTPRQIRRLDSFLQEHAARVAREAARRDRLDLIEEVAAPLPVAVMIHLMGLPPEDESDYRRWARALILGPTGDATPSEQAHTVAALEALGERMLEVAERRRREPGDDLVSALVAAERDEDVMTPKQVVATAAHLLAAGSETTESFLGTFFAELLQRPAETAALRDDPGALPAAIEEVLRFDSPSQLLQRRATRLAELAGVRIPEGTIVILLLGSANRDERRFVDPDVLDLARDASGHLAFGFGSHFCLGAALARLETRRVIEPLLPLLPQLELEPEGVRRHRSFLSRGYARLPVRRRA